MRSRIFEPKKLKRFGESLAKDLNGGLFHIIPYDERNFKVAEVAGVNLKAGVACGNCPNMVKISPNYPDDRSTYEGNFSILYWADENEFLCYPCFSINEDEVFRLAEGV